MDCSDGRLYVDAILRGRQLMIGASGHQDIVTELLNAGADPKTTNEKEQTPLYVLARSHKTQLTNQTLRSLQGQCICRLHSSDLQMDSS